MRAATARVGQGSRLLDMGTGPFAVVGLAVWHRRRCQVTCSDVEEGIVARARQTVALNGAPCQVVAARFFGGLGGGFDLVAFNAPYVPAGDLLGGERWPAQSDGGPAGTDVVEGFLDAFAAEGGTATALLGVGGLHVPASRVLELVRSRPLTLESVVSSPWQANVFVLKRA